MDFTFSRRIAGMGSNAIRDIFKLLADPEVISFAGGWPALDCLPLDEVKKFQQEVMNGKDNRVVLQYGATEGYKPMKDSAPLYLSRKGLSPRPEDCLIISGGQQGIDLMFKAFINPGDVVLFENPTYLAALQIARSYEAVTIGVDADDFGLSVEDLEYKIKKYSPKVLYLVPTFSNPTGKTLSVERRKAIAELTAKHGVVVIEDDPYSELRFEGEDVPAMKSFDKTGNICYVTSFSKTVAPGLRTGIAYCSPEMMRGLVVGKQTTDVHTGLVNQAVIARFIESGELSAQIDRIRPKYKVKKDAMIQAVDKYFPEEFKHTNPEGGLFIWGEFPDYIDTVECFPEVVAMKAAYVPGTSFFADNGGRNTLRLNYSNASLEQIETGIKKIGGYFKEKVAKLKR